MWRRSIKSLCNSLSRLKWQLCGFLARTGWKVLLASKKEKQLDLPMSGLVAPITTHKRGNRCCIRRDTPCCQQQDVIFSPFGFGGWKRFTYGLGGCYRWIPQANSLPQKGNSDFDGGWSPDAERGLIFNFSILWCNLSKIDLRTGYYKVSTQQKFVRGKENKLVL